MKPGDKVQARDGLGNLVVRDAVIVRYQPGASVVFVEGFDRNSRGPWGDAPALIGVPVSAVEAIPETPKPSPRLIGVLRECFGLRAIK